MTTDHNGEQIVDEIPLSGGSKIMRIARGYLGMKEIRGRRHNKEIIALIKGLGHNWYVKDEIPWCAGYVGWVLKKAGYKHTHSLMARSYVRWGQKVRKGKAKLGDVLVFSRGKPPSGHVGFYAGETRTHYKVLGGNQRNTVCVALYPKSRCIAIRRAPSMRRSRVATGSAMGLLGTVGSQAAELAPQVEQIGGEVSMLAQYLPVLGYVATGLAIAGVCLALYARWDDMRTKGA